MKVINAVAQFERGLLVERTQSGLASAKVAGKPVGGPTALPADQQDLVKKKSGPARLLVDRSTVGNHQNLRGQATDRSIA